MYINKEHVKERIKQMRPNDKMESKHYHFFEGYCCALEWILDE